MAKKVKKEIKVQQQNTGSSVFDDIFGSFNLGSNVSDNNFFTTNKNKSKRKSALTIEQQVPQVQQVQQVPQVQQVQEISNPNEDIEIPKSLQDLQYEDLDKKARYQQLKSILAKDIKTQQEIIQQPIQTPQVEQIIPAIQNIPDSLDNPLNIVQQILPVEPSNSELLPDQEVNQNLQIVQLNNVSEEDVRQVLEEETNLKNIPEDIDVKETIEEVTSALTEIPDGKDLDLSDFELKPVERKDKTGYKKLKVSLKKSNIPEVINIISSYIKKHSKGLISPRVCDFRVIGNTNKTQLRNSSVKLSSVTIVYKPDSKIFKVNKGTRFMISVPEDFESTGNLIVYLQESRKKVALVIERNEFQTQELFNEFIGDRIAEYYTLGYDVVAKKLMYRQVDNPLMRVISSVVKSGGYKAKPYSTPEGKIYCVDFYSKGNKNQWLYVRVMEGSVDGHYYVSCKNKVDDSWEFRISGKKTIATEFDISLQTLMNKLHENLNFLFEKEDWGVEEKEDDKIYYMLDKLTYRKLKAALITINEISEENPDLGIQIAGSLSKLDTAKSVNKEYEMEAIVGKTNTTSKFILAYYAYQIIGGDKRNGKQYITNNDYYQKYSVKDRREYQEREKTILKKEGESRNYNARPYVFQLEYSLNNETILFRAYDFETIVEETNFLFNPKKPKIKSL